MQIQFPRPASWVCPSFRLIRYDDDLRIWYQSFDADEMLRLMSCRSDEEILDVVVRSTESEVRIGSTESDVRRLRELADCI